MSEMDNGRDEHAAPREQAGSAEPATSNESGATNEPVATNELPAAAAQPQPTSELPSAQPQPTSEFPASYDQPPAYQPYGQPTYGQPYAGGPGGYQQPPYGQPGYPSGQYGESPYGANSPSWANPYGPTEPNSPDPAAGGTAVTPDRPERPARSRTGRTILVAAVTAAVIGGGIGAGTVAVFDHHNNSSSGGISVTASGAPVAAKIDGTVTAAAAKIQPSVVTINVAGAQEQGTGSGVIIRSDGYILTNNHVVDIASGGGTISVITNDGQQAAGTVVGTDPSDDLAVVKVSGLKNLTAATFGKSSNLVVGQTVVAVGAPLGLSDTVTSGIISNTARPVTTGDSQTSEAVFNAVQTDAAINPGNSGGPLVDLNGNVVGINAAIATANSGGLQVPGQQATESGSIGIGFAIPADEASRIAGQLISTGKATHAVIGVTVNGNQSQGTTAGATIASVDANSAAAAAGLKAGDIVTTVGTQRIDDPNGLIAAVRSHAPGETVGITYVRGGVSKTVQVKLGTASS